MPDPASATEAEVMQALADFQRAAEESGRDRRDLLRLHALNLAADRLRAALRLDRQQARASGVAEGIERAAKYCDDAAEMWRGETRRTHNPAAAKIYADNAATCHANACSIRALGRDQEGK